MNYLSFGEKKFIADVVDVAFYFCLSTDLNNYDICASASITVACMLQAPASHPGTMSH